MERLLYLSLRCSNVRLPASKGFKMRRIAFVFMFVVFFGRQHRVKGKTWYVDTQQWRRVEYAWINQVILIFICAMSPLDNCLKFKRFGCVCRTAFFCDGDNEYISTSFLFNRLLWPLFRLSFHWQMRSTNPCSYEYDSFRFKYIRGSCLYWNRTVTSCTSN